MIQGTHPIGGYPQHLYRAGEGGDSFLRYIPGEFRFTKRWRGAEGLSCSLVSGFCCLLLQLVTADRSRFCHLRLISPGWAVPRAAWDGPWATRCSLKCVPREMWLLWGRRESPQHLTMSSFTDFHGKEPRKGVRVHPWSDVPRLGRAGQNLSWSQKQRVPSRRLWSH